MTHVFAARRGFLALAATILAAPLPGLPQTPSASSPASPLIVKTAEFPRPATPPLGINLEQVLDYAHSMMFVDCIKSARKFGTPDAPWDGTAPLDENGWPTTDAGTVVVANAPLAPGDYLFACTGRCDLSVVNSKATVKLQSYDRDKKTTTATVTVLPNADSLFLAFRHTTGGVKNIRLLRPGYPLKSTDLFNKDFLTAIAPFSTLRLMDFTRTNETEVKEWNQRAKPTDAMQSSKAGAAWEYGIMLANQTGKDIWINIPVRASDDYVKQLAQLLKSTLNKDRVVYVEYSNEVWNSIFPQSGYDYEAAKAEVAAGNSPLNDGGKDPNTYYWAWKRVAKRLVEISNIFKAVYAQDGARERPRSTPPSGPVLASQSARGIMLRLQLELIEKYYGRAPNKFIYGVAGAPYIGPDAKVDGRDDATAEELIDSTADSGMKWIKDVTLQYLIIARYYRLHALCYEGGPGFVGEHSVDAKVAANRDPRIGKLIQDYLAAWYANDGELFMYFDLAGGYSKYGCWGLTEDIRNTTPKTKAIAAVKAHAAAPARTGGDRRPRSRNRPGHAIRRPRRRQRRNHLLRRKRCRLPPGWPLVRISRQRHRSRLLCLHPAIRQRRRPRPRRSPLQRRLPRNPRRRAKTGDWWKWADTTPVKVRLEKGQLVIRLRILKGGMNIRSFTLKKP